MSEQEHKGQQDGPQGSVPGPPPPRVQDQPPAAPWNPAPPPPGAWQSPQGGAQQPPANPWAQPQQGSAWDSPNPYAAAGPGFPQQHGYTPPPKPGIIPLRPLGLGEMMDGAFQACRRNVLAAFGNSLLIQGIITALTVGLGFGMISSLEDAALSGASDDELAGPVLGALTGFVGLGIISLVGVMVVQGLLVVPVARATLNLRTGFSQMWRIARRSILRLAGLALVLLAASAVAVTVLVLLFSLVIYLLGDAGIAVVVIAVLALAAVTAWVSVKLALAPAALVLEGTGIFRSIARSWQLTGRNWWRTFGILILTSMIVGILTQILTIPFSFIIGFAGASTEDPAALVASSVLLIAVTLLVSAVGYAFQGAVTALLYVDLRIRREGFDLALMKDQEGPHTQDPDFLPGRHAVPMSRKAPAGPPMGMP